jgi:hypothetical protein
MMTDVKVRLMVDDQRRRWMMIDVKVEDDQGDDCAIKMKEGNNT